MGLDVTEFPQSLDFVLSVTGSAASVIVEEMSWIVLMIITGLARNRLLPLHLSSNDPFYFSPHRLICVINAG